MNMNMNIFENIYHVSSDTHFMSDKYERIEFLNLLQVLKPNMYVSHSTIIDPVTIEYG